MNHKHWLTCLALASLAAQAEPLLQGKRIVTDTAQGGLAARSAGAVQSDKLDAAGQRRLVSDGQGNVAATGSGAFETASGLQGTRSARFTRSADGSGASGQRNTSVTNSNTGVSFDGSTTYTKGSGVSRSAGCTDAAGNTVTCGSAR